MTSGAGNARRGDVLLQHEGREQEAAERRAGGLDHAAMAERHEQESGVGDQRHHGTAEHHQHKAPAPADAAEITDAGAFDQRQERDARPDIAMHEQIDRGETDLEAVPRAGKAQRPEQRSREAADDADNAGAASFF